MTFPIKTVIPTVITQISGIAGLVFRKQQVKPIRTEGNFSQYELGTGLYEIHQEDMYLYLFVEHGRGQYVTISGALQKAEQLQVPDEE
ncbi:hypothetical protein [Paenibacillus shenyangensis]|uniref:hypothetical protein n=1 Tax=Paenibacillus sp. A9 TaxID=1284352 RepID=UPI00035EFDFE|nr:hypothetical protein [Paenibacillus sp. A9]